MNRIEKDVNGVKIIAEKFSGIHDFLSAYENKPISENYKDHQTAAIIQNETYESRRAEFAGVSGYPAAVEQLKNGVNVSAIKMARIAAETATKRAIKKSVNGGRVSVPSYLSGSPACMRKMVKLPAKTGINVVIDMGVSSFTTAEEITKAGQCVVEYVTKLESRYNVSLHACGAVSFGEKKNRFTNAYIFGIKIKDAGKPFSAARVSFCLTSAAFLRVFGFAWITRADGVPYSGGLGTPTSTKMEQEKEIMQSVYKNAITVSINDVIKSGEKAFPKIK